MGRRTLFRPRIIDEEDLREWSLVESAYGNGVGAATRKRVVEAFSSLMKLNGITDPAEGLSQWAGAAHRDGLRWATINTYAGYLSAVYRPPLTPDAKLLWDEKRRIINACHADETTGGALACTTVEYCNILKNLNGVEDSLTRAAVCLIALTGMRLADIRRLRRRQINLRKRTLKIEVRVAKNRRRRSLRRIHSIRCGGPIVKIDLDPILRRLLRSGGHPDACLFQPVTTSVINERLSRLNSPHQYTTYSFRKMYINNVISHFGDDWPTIIHHTMHTGINVVKSHYQALDVGDEG
jgi:integrase